jgi:hypothetical protein
MRKKKVINKEYREVLVEIAFNPLEAHFEVSDAAIKKDPFFMSDISNIWIDNKPSRRTINDFIEKLKLTHNISQDEEDVIARNIDSYTRKISLQPLRYTQMQMSKSQMFCEDQQRRSNSWSSRFHPYSSFCLLG